MVREREKTTSTTAVTYGAANEDAEFHPTSSASHREFMPAIGLKEYWYPAIEARKVRGKPVGLKICGDQVVFFKGKEKGEVSALANVCPHRGGSLMHGDCHYPGTVSCPYHGWTFNGAGDVLAVLPEGPDSQVPGKIIHRSYPTQNLRGMIWIWMGEGEPAPIEEDVPPEFFWDEGVLLFGTEVWPSNWRVAIENVSDAHVPYVHRDATFTLLVPMPLTGPEGARTIFVNDRYLGQPSMVEAAQPKDGAPQRIGARVRGKLQYFFPAVGGTWPLHQRRNLWTWATKWIQKRRFARPAMEPNPEWAGIGRHLPAIVHIDYRTHIFNRINIPIDENNTRQMYTHATRANGLLARLYERVVFHTFHRWAHFSDFSVQDFKVLNPQRYDAPEYLSLTDMPNVNWRRLVALHARDLNPAGSK
jgi:phenylpropionate dioxygenase-like ring-hydroxylating dioxygenase large terminal subunit